MAISLLEKGVTLPVQLQKHEMVMVNISAEWCQDCKDLKPGLEKYAENHEVIKIDFDANKEWAISKGIKRIPTTTLFVNGNPVIRMTGATSYEALEANHKFWEGKISEMKKK